MLVSNSMNPKVEKKGRRTSFDLFDCLNTKDGRVIDHSFHYFLLAKNWSRWNDLCRGIRLVPKVSCSL